MTSARKTRGFTLVELLVVIAIIGMVTALAVPTIFSAVASARNAKTKAEIDMLHVALMNYKNEYGSFPPAYFGSIPANPAPIALDNAVTYKKHPVYRHLTRIFPRITENQAAYAQLANLSPAQAIVFWLQGFYQNPTNPITNGNPNWPGTNSSYAGTRQKLFEFDESRLYGIVPGTPQQFRPRTPTDAFPVYFTGHPTCGLPYVYFDSRCYDNPPTGVASPDVVYSATSLAGDTSTASPYITSTPPTNPTWGQQHTNGETFQLIAAGRDGSYGTNQAVFPGSSTSFTPSSWPSLTFPPVTDSTLAPGHGDNITNFADRPLADAAQALQSP